MPIMRTLLNTPEIGAQFKLNAVITLVDAKNITDRLAEAEGAAADTSVSGACSK